MTYPFTSYIISGKEIAVRNLMSKAKNKYLVLGVGNILLKDEGLGVRAVEYMRERYSFPEGVSLVDGGTAGLGLLSLLKDFDHIIIIDAVTPRTFAGAIHRIPGEQLTKTRGLMTAAHGIGVSEALAAGALEGYAPQVVVIGMEPAEVSLGMELTEAVSRRLGELAETVAVELLSLGVKLRKRRARA